MKELIQNVIILKGFSLSSCFQDECIVVFSFSSHFEGYNVTMATAGHRAMVNATNSRAGWGRRQVLMPGPTLTIGLKSWEQPKTVKILLKNIYNILISQYQKQGKVRGKNLICILLPGLFVACQYFIWWRKHNSLLTTANDGIKKTRYFRHSR